MEEVLFWLWKGASAYCAEMIINVYGGIFNRDTTSTTLSYLFIQSFTGIVSKM